MPKTMLSPRRLPAPARAVIILMLGLGVGACATTQTPADAALSGHWRLDQAASDRIDIQVTRAVANAERRERQRERQRRGRGAAGAVQQDGPAAHRGAGAGEASGITEDQFGNITAIAPDFPQLRERLLQTLDAPVMLVLAVQPGLIDIQADGLPARDYHPGEKITRLDEYGTAVLDSHWSGMAFVLRERYTSGAKLTERYQLGRDGTLTCTRSLADPIIGKLELKSVYRRS